VVARSDLDEVKYLTLPRIEYRSSSLSLVTILTELPRLTLDSCGRSIHNVRRFFIHYQSFIDVKFPGKRKRLWHICVPPFMMKL